MLLCIYPKISILNLGIFSTFPITLECVSFNIIFFLVSSVGVARGVDHHFQLAAVYETSRWHGVFSHLS